MKTLAVIAAVWVVLGVGACAFVVSGFREDVDRAEHLAENRRLLATLPEFPGSQVVGVRHTPTRYEYDPCCGSFIDGYISDFTYQSPPRTSAAQITRFFERELPMLGWRRNSWGKYPAGWPKVLTGKVNVMAIGYQAGEASASVSLIPFIRGNRIVRGGRFVVSVNYLGYRSLP